MVPLTLGLIEEGGFSERLDEAFAELQRRAIAYREKYGEKAKKSTAVLTAEITLCCEEPNSNYFSIKTQLKSKLPQPPAKVTTAIANEAGDEQLSLFVKSGGSAMGNPRQGKFLDAENKAIN
jgi:hypothetical protein